MSLSHMNRLFWVGSLGLLALLSLQLASRWAVTRRLETRELQILESGVHLSDLLTGDLAPVAGRGCGPVYFVDPLCPSCQFLAKRWEADGRPAGLWIISRNREPAEAFALEYGIPQADAVFLDDWTGQSPRLREIGIHAAPTTAVLDEAGFLHHIRGGTVLVTDSVLRLFCHQEGR